MIKKFSFWVVIVLILSLGSVVGIHWNTLQGIHKRVAWVQPLYQRQKVVSHLSLALERYRQMSSVFRKWSPEEITKAKEKLRSVFLDSVTQLDSLSPTDEERINEHRLADEINDFLTLVTQVEPMLYSKDAYIKSDVVELHDKIRATLMNLEKSNDSRITALHLNSSPTEPQSVIFLLIVGGIIFLLMLSLILKNYWSYLRPLRKLHEYAIVLKSGSGNPQNPPHLVGMFGAIQNSLSQLALSVETHVRDRHKFILDIVADLKAPLTMLQDGKYLVEGSGPAMDEERQHQAAESVRRGLAIFAGSLDDLNDIVDINRLESRLENRTVDLSDLMSDVSRTLMGSDLARRIQISVPPIPLWISVDVKRFERALVHVLSKIVSTLNKDGALSISVSQSMQGGFRGIEIVIQDADRLRAGRVAAGGPEQDILRHWISENGLSMALVHKIIKAHGGSITAAGVAGTSVTAVIRLPQERVVSRGLISPPTHDEGLRGLVVKNQPLTHQTSALSD